MRSLLLLPLSAVLLSACLTSQTNPNYEQSTTYRGDTAAPTQYAAAPSVDISNATFDSATSQYVFADQASISTASHQQTATYEAVPVFAHPAPAIPTGTTISTAPISTASVSTATAPTDSVYNAQDITGTPGFMAMQASQQAVVQAQAAPALPAAQFVNHAPIGAAGTPITYDYTRNIIAADAITTGQQIPDSVRVLQGAEQNYTVQPGDTVYSLSRRTCVGVNVIQSMNGLASDYGINIGQSLRLPASVC